MPLLLAAASVLAGGEAAAAISVTNITIASDAGTPLTRPAPAQYWISYDDCIHDTILQFTVASDAAFTAAASASLNCSDGTPLTVLGTTPYSQCYDIASNVSNGTVIPVHAYDLVKGTLGIDCRTSVAIPSGESFTWPAAITFYFYVPIAGALATDSTVWPAASSTGPTTEDISLVGPQPPAPISVNEGNEILLLDLPATPTDSRTVGYYAFCYPQEEADEDGGAGGAGGGAGGAGGGTGTSACPAGTTLPEVPSLSSKYLCGAQIAPTTTSWPITAVNGAPLEDGTKYIVAVAAYDEVNNLGPISALQCATPQPASCTDGGVGCVKAGGGCEIGTLGGGTGPVWPVLGIGALAAAGIMVRRERRRRAASRPV